MVAADLIARYEVLLEQYLMRHKLLGLPAVLDEDEELDRLDSQLIELERRLPKTYRLPSPSE